MKSSLCAIVPLVAFLACSSDTPPGKTPPPPDAVPSTPAVGPEGYGTVRIGMTLSELNAALNQNLKPAYEVNDECDYVTPAGLPAGMAVMIERDTVVRIDVDSAGVRTVEGAGVGDDEARVLALYAGRVQVMPHKYGGPEDHYVVVTVASDTLVRVIFETEKGEVTQYRAGRRPAVEYVEGCA